LPETLFFIFSTKVAAGVEVMAKKPRVRSQLLWVVTITFWTFVLSLLMSLFSQAIFFSMNSIILALIVLLFIIFVGIIFDMIGIAAAAAEEAPFLAKAAKKVPGAREALYIVRNADRFSNFCNDVIGDIAGVVSGTLGALLVLNLVTKGFFRDNTVISIVATGLISALTVGGKALGKTYALKKSTEIVLGFAYVLLKIETLFAKKIFFGHALPPRRK